MILRMMKNKIFILTATLLVATQLPAFSKSLKKANITIVRAEGTTVQCNAELAITPEERNFGFMKRKNIPDGTGMLFIFEKEQILSFWMKNTPHPLSIAYIDSRGKIRNLYDMTPFSLAPIVSTASCRYALEVPQGWYEKNNITIGDTVILP